VLVGVAGCYAPHQVELGGIELNQKLRLDRQALTPEQVSAAADELAFGPYRDAPDDLVTPIVPLSEWAHHMPQSDCLFIAQAEAGGGDGVRAHWEAVLELIPSQVSEFYDPEDGELDVSACRFNDPQTRLPLRHTDRDLEDETFIEDTIDCALLGPTEGIPAVVHSWPTCSSDLQLVGTALSVYVPSQQNPFRLCDRSMMGVRPGVGGLRADLDGYAGPSGTRNVRGQDINESISCSGSGGQVLIPSEPTVYLAGVDIGYFAILDTQYAQRVPLIMPARKDSTLARTFTEYPDGVQRWATPVRQRTFDKVRWEDNFNTTLRVKRARIFRLGANNTQVDLNPVSVPELCITDGESGSAECRWRCRDTSANAVMDYDLLAGGACVDGLGAQSFPVVTPSYALDTVQAKEVRLPLIWGAQLPGESGLMIEFTLTHTLAPFALTASAGQMDMGAGRIGEAVRGKYELRNLGGDPVRVTAVRTLASTTGCSNLAGEFSTNLPYAPAPIPLPVDMTWTSESTAVASVGHDAESQQLFTVQEDHAHVRLSPRRGDFTAIVAGHPVRSHAGLLVRDSMDNPWATLVANRPLTRTTYLLRQPPFVLAPGQGADVSVLARPAMQGTRCARIEVSGESVLDPAQRGTVTTYVSIRGMLGPRTEVSPAQLFFSANRDGESQRRGVLLVNAGDTAGAIGAVQLKGASGASLPTDTPFILEDSYGPGSLDAGQSRVAYVGYTADCSRNVVGGWREDRAEVQWQVPAGMLRVPVEGRVYCH
jgi:hypothetical protein